MFGVIAETDVEARATVEAARAAVDQPHEAVFVQSPGATLGLLIDTATGAREAFHHGSGRDCAAIAGAITTNGRPPEGTEAAATLLRMANDDALDRAHDLSGLFAAAIWQGESGRLTLLSDWIGGIHQLFHARTPAGFIFGTDAHSMLASGAWGGKVDDCALGQYLDFGHSLPPGTLFEGILKLPAGCQLSYHAGEVQVRRTFQPSSSRDGETGDAAGRLRDAHREAVARCMRSSGEVGAFLSGGLDSSLNVAAMSELSDAPVRTFSVAYPGEEIDESRYARLVADRFNTEHHELPLESAGVLDELPEMVWALEEPAMDYSFIPTFNLARFARKHVPAVISGDGPDHLFGRHYPVALIRGTLGRVPGVRAIAAAVTGGERRGRLWRRLRGSPGGRHLWKALQSVGCDPLQAYLSIYREIACRGLLPERADGLLCDQARADVGGGEIDPLMAGIADAVGGEFDRIIALDLNIDGSCGVFAKVGKMAAHHDLAVHEPYLDARVRDLIDALPAHLKARGSVLDLPGKRLRRKVLLYEAARGALPQEVLDKPKQGFRAPIADWLREWLEGRDAEQLLPALTGEIALLDIARVNALLDEHLRDERNHETLIMMLITLDLWYAVFVLGKARKPDWRWSEWIER